MQDKKEDRFFDEVSAADQQSDQLMKMIDNLDKKIRTDLDTGSKVSGTITRIGEEYCFVDIGAKNEALIKVTELLEKDGGLSVKLGDRISAFIISSNSGEIILSKSIGGKSVPVDEIIEAMNNKVPVQGKVTGINKGGLSVKVLGHRAFCPTSQIDVKFTEDVNPYLGKTLDFVVTQVTEGGRNIVLSRVPLLEQGLEEKIAKLETAAQEKDILKGTISKITDFGLFIDAGGIEGLVHISEVSWERAENLSESFGVGQDVEFMVLKVERKKPLRNTKISLSIKQILENPWDMVARRFSVGQSLQGKVTRLAAFGAFVELMPGVEGLVHVSEMSWIKRVSHPSEIVSEGSLVNVTILNIDEKKKSISLSLKDVSNDPWRDIDTKLPAGSDVEGTVSKKTRYGYFIDIEEGITGLLPFANIVSDKKDSLVEGEKVKVHIESIDKENRRISLSMGLKESHQDQKEVKEFLKKQQSHVSVDKPASTEFGAALMAALKHKK
jgi:small subunit ribosomal protein S1